MHYRDSPKHFSFRKSLVILFLLMLFLLPGCRNTGETIFCIANQRYTSYEQIVVESFEYSFFYDQNGNFTELFARFGEETAKAFFTYNNSGKLLEMQGYSDDELTCGLQYTYYEDGTVCTKTTTEQSGAVSVMEYDERGNLRAHTVLLPDGSLDQNTVYNYDSENRKLGYKMTNAEGVVLDQAVYTYDQAGNKILDTRSPLRYTQWKYDKAGNVLEQAYYENGSLADRSINTYDEKGSHLTAQYIAHGKVINTCTMTYHANGNLATSLYKADGTYHYTEYDADGNTLVKDYRSETDCCREEYSYDAYGNILSYKRYDEDGKLDYHRTYSYTYDSKGNLLEERSEDVLGGSVYRTLWTYNKAGLLVRKEEFSNHGTREIPGGCYVCSYDHVGNLTSIKRYYGEKQGLQEEVTFTYVPIFVPQEQIAAVQEYQQIVLQELLDETPLKMPSVNNKLIG